MAEIGIIEVLSEERGIKRVFCGVVRQNNGGGKTLIIYIPKALLTIYIKAIELEVSMTWMSSDRFEAKVRAKRRQVLGSRW